MFVKTTFDSNPFAVPSNQLLQRIKKQGSQHIFILSIFGEHRQLCQTFLTVLS